MDEQLRPGGRNLAGDEMTIFFVVLVLAAVAAVGFYAAYKANE